MVQKKKYNKSKKKHIKRRRNGGKFIAKGAFGCVYSPNYKCDADDVVSNNKISKVFRNSKDMNNELNEYNKIKNIDPSGKYFFKVFKSCKLDRKLNAEEIKKNGSKGCHADSGTHMYIGQNAGPDLLDHDFDNINDFNKCFYNIFLGLKKLKDNNLVHRDIKRENLSINSDGLGMILDYGTVVSLDEWFKDNKNNSLITASTANITFNGTPYYMPIETLYFIGIVHKKPGKPFILVGNVNTNDFLKQMNKFFSKDLKLDDTNLKKSLINSPKKESYINNTITKLGNEYNTAEDYKVSDLFNYVSQLHKWDIYASGLAMVHILNSSNINKPSQLVDLIDNMIKPYHKDRYSIYEVLNHPYVLNNMGGKPIQKKITKLDGKFSTIISKQIKDELNIKTLKEKKKYKKVTIESSSSSPSPSPSPSHKIKQKPGDMDIFNRNMYKNILKEDPTNVFFIKKLESLENKFNFPKPKKSATKMDLFNRKLYQDGINRNPEFFKMKLKELEDEVDFSGGKKKSKKSVKKRIRKHSGINQSTGKLKKGYKYSGKKLKSGLSEIIKLKNRK